MCRKWERSGEREKNHKTPHTYLIQRNFFHKTVFFAVLSLRLCHCNCRGRPRFCIWSKFKDAFAILPPFTGNLTVVFTHIAEEPPGELFLISHRRCNRSCRCRCRGCSCSLACSVDDRCTFFRSVRLRRNKNDTCMCACVVCAREHLWAFVCMYVACVRACVRACLARSPMIYESSFQPLRAFFFQVTIFLSE